MATKVMTMAKIFTGSLRSSACKAIGIVTKRINVLKNNIDLSICCRGRKLPWRRASWISSPNFLKLMAKGMKLRNIKTIVKTFRNISISQSRLKSSKSVVPSPFGSVPYAFTNIFADHNTAAYCHRAASCKHANAIAIKFTGVSNINK